MHGITCSIGKASRVALPLPHDQHLPPANLMLQLQTLVCFTHTHLPFCTVYRLKTP
jgi:hypothetical protein